MKKLLALLAAVAAVSGTAFASGTVNLTNYDPIPDKPVYFQTAGTLASGSDFYAEVWGGPVGGTQTLLHTEGGTATELPISDGYFDGVYAQVPGVADGGQATLTLKAYKGSSWATATYQASVTWDQKLGAAANLTAEPPTIQTPTDLLVPSNLVLTPTVVVPEPTTMALGMLGAAALLIRRRK